MLLSLTKLSWQNQRILSTISPSLYTTPVSFFLIDNFIILEAGYALRKHIIDKAKAHAIWSKDLKEVNVGEVLAVTAKKSRATE